MTPLTKRTLKGVISHAQSMLKHEETMLDVEIWWGLRDMVQHINIAMINTERNRARAGKKSAKPSLTAQSKQ